LVSRNEIVNFIADARVMDVKMFATLMIDLLDDKQMGQVSAYFEKKIEFNPPRMTRKKDIGRRREIEVKDVEEMADEDGDSYGEPDDESDEEEMGDENESGQTEAQPFNDEEIRDILKNA